MSKKVNHRYCLNVLSDGVNQEGKGKMNAHATCFFDDSDTYGLCRTTSRHPLMWFNRRLFGEFGGWINLSEAPTIAAQHGSTKLACFTFEFFSYSLSKTHAILLSLGTPTAKHYALPSDSVILGCSCLFFDLPHKDPGDHTTGVLHDSLEFFVDC